jgi:hypothetical protein
MSGAGKKVPRHTFLGTGSGTIRVVKLPEDTEADFKELHVVGRV